MTEALFTPLKVGGIEAANRIVMAPLTRSRANDDSGEVGDMHVEYYAQRAGAGRVGRAAQHAAEAVRAALHAARQGGAGHAGLPAYGS